MSYNYDSDEKSIFQTKTSMTRMGKINYVIRQIKKETPQWDVSTRYAKRWWAFQGMGSSMSGTSPSMYLQRMPMPLRFSPPCGMIRSAYFFVGSMNCSCMGLSTSR